MTDWQQLRSSDFALPDEVRRDPARLDALVAELTDLLASRDPLERDETAYAALVTWIGDGVLPDDRLRPLGHLVAARFTADEVQARSFAPLVLAALVSRGVCEPGWIDAFEQWYAAEPDLRGHDADLGWVHAVAHGADLLGEAGRHPDVVPRRMLDLAAARLVAPVDEVWHDQEHDRLAHAVALVLARPDLAATDALGWLDPVADLLAAGEPGPVPAHVSNTLHTLRMLYLLVDRGVRTGPDEVVEVVHRRAVLDRLAEVLHTVTPWMW
ncbi:DUF2785 domain-containing protein [Nocardioides sp. KIGAM211]|uniref:DUF2785 domain-containing protein n=1 Tax=Nocardioides luti TaxID=2761101 RepID=A0A7X0RCK6_9ACTN|nr:DUF2785 domain-containing protein [Nocardioides luti]MBB6625734.1 DUF2785 domain-containing protein [Nocardioides luti]